jgi:hypothetical protein
MTPRRARGARLAGLALVGLALAGCALGRPARGAPEAGCLPTGRSLIVARVGTDENRPTAEEAAELLANGLRETAHVIGVRELLGEARLAGLGVWASGVSERLQTGGWLTAEEGGVLGERFGIRTLVATHVTEYDQVWGKYAKFTRAGVDAQAFDLIAARVVWRLRGDAEVEDMRGRAFRVAMEEAVQELSHAMCPRQAFSLVNAWRYWRR